jgi:hypothetical protein
VPAGQGGLEVSALLDGENGAMPVRRMRNAKRVETGEQVFRLSWRHLLPLAQALGNV